MSIRSTVASFGRPSISFPRDGLAIAARPSLLAGCLAATFALAVPVGTHASERQAAGGATVRVPRTPEDHLELAQRYSSLAGKERQRAESLRASLARDLERFAVPPNKTGRDYPWVAKRKQEGEQQISHAAAAAAEAQRFAEFHRMRAKEIEGLEFATLMGADGQQR